MGGVAVLIAFQEHADPHACGSLPPQRDEHPLAPAGRAAHHRRRPPPAMQQGIGDGLDLLDPPPGERLQQRRHVGSSPNDHRDGGLALLDPP